MKEIHHKKGQKGYCTKIANKDEYLIETNK